MSASIHWLPRAVFRLPARNCRCRWAMLLPGALLLWLALLFSALPDTVSAQGAAAVKDIVGSVWTFALHFKAEEEAEALPEHINCSLKVGSGKALIANGSPDSDATAAFGNAIASLRTLPALGYPLTGDPLAGLDITLTFAKGNLPHLGGGQGLAYAVAAYSALTSAPALGDVALAGTLDAAGNVGPIESADLLVKAAADKPLSTVILPAQNQADVELLPKEVKLKVRIVLVQNLHQALFYSLGRWGPQGQSYLYLQEVYRRAVNYLWAGDFDHAVYFFRELQARLPEDTSFALWLSTLEERRAEAQSKKLVDEALHLLYSGDLAGARGKIEAAMAVKPDSPEAKEALARLVAVEQDPQPPQLSVNVEEGQRFAAQQEVVVRATDNYGIAKVAVSVDGELVASGNSVPLTTVLDTTSLAAGSHSLRVEVTDISGNMSKIERSFSVVPSAAAEPASG